MSAISSDLLHLIAQTTRDFIAEPSSALDVNIDRTLRAIGALFDADRTYLFQLSEEQGHMCNTHEWCSAGIEPQIRNLQDVPLDVFPWWMGELRADRIINLSSLCDLPPGAESEREVLENQGIASLLVIPMVRSGRLEGFAGFDHVRGVRCWSQEETAVLRIIVNCIAQGFERRQVDLRLEQMAFEDSLTGLPNRVLLGRRLHHALEQARVSGMMLAVCYLDLDFFKRVNDNYGHAAGDELLVLMADRLRNALRPVDTLARLGGDEFVVVLPELANRDQVLKIGQDLLDLIARPCTISAGITVVVSASLGIRIVPPDDADPDLLLRQADQAMYGAKRAGRSRIQLFDTSLEKRENQRRAEILVISEAISAGHLRLFVQPIMDLASGEVRCAEALVRWQHPQRGLLAPDRWLPWIIDQPEVTALGTWVLNASLTVAGLWRRAGMNLAISVNVSARELQDPGFVEQLAELLGRHQDVPPSALKLEVLETAAFENLARARQTMHRCIALGVGFALDDFGTGYSSLMYLRELPISSIKIDRSFVSHMLNRSEDRQIVRSVIGLAHGFDRLCVAEGIETPDHMEMLRSMGCDWGQGHGLARPMPAEAFEPWLRGRQQT
jgi:diguanylate cyclase (GGDEF)-like protein